MVRKAKAQKTMYTGSGHIHVSSGTKMGVNRAINRINKPKNVSVLGVKVRKYRV